jgi:homoprotocatechuate degradation regulator HpaR
VVSFLDKYIISSEFEPWLFVSKMASFTKKTAAKADRFSSETDTGAAVALPIRSFGRSLPMLLMRAREAVMQRFRPHLREHDITEQQWRILRVLAEEKDVDMLSLATRCSIQPPSLSRTIRLLVTRGLVRRCNHGIDQRRIMVDLTPKGRSLFRTMSEESAKIYANLQADVGEERLSEIYRVLDELIVIASPRGVEEEIESSEL